MMKKIILLLILAFLLLPACKNDEKKESSEMENNMNGTDHEMEKRIAAYAHFPLTSDLSTLSKDQKLMLTKLIEAARYMDTLFIWQAYGDPKELFSMDVSPEMMEYIRINYGPWDRLRGNEPFVPGVGPKPAGANFYPRDMSKEEFEAADIPNKRSQYTLIRRDEDGNLISVWYHARWKELLAKSAKLLEEAAMLAESQSFRTYLLLRAEALLKDDFIPSDRAWLLMDDNLLDIVIGPIETYEDELFGYKAAYEAYVLIKDKEWSKRLQKFAGYLPYLQKTLPVADEYKQEEPGTSAQLNAYDAVFYAGNSNAGSKTIAINLPNDEGLQQEIGSRRLQLKNAMKAKFDKILLPIADVIIDPSQRGNINFDAFFGNTMFHEVAHGLGIKNVLDGSGTVRNALRDLASAIEEGKADILGIYMITKLKEEKGELADVPLESYYTTFLASIFRSIRFGSASAHGKANLIRFNFFKEMGAFIKGPAGYYKVNLEKFKEAIDALSARILTLQGDGNYEAVKSFVEKYGHMGDELRNDLKRINEAGIPVDIVFEQGEKVLGL